MLSILLGVFFVLHGLVHLLYFGKSAHYFELQPGMVWPSGSWAFSKVLGDAMIRNLASILLILAAIGFIAGGIGVFFQQTWWRALVVGTAIFSSMVFLLLWDAGFQHLDNKGGVGILINLAILVVLLVFRCPAFDS
ncbi:MAG: hypothetical protein JW730_04480 [Anaerolineales bacterium]|nr:hypothetical protein [Anaerolineales bacterium]